MSNKILEMLRRARNPNQMDFDSALSQMVQLCGNAQPIYKLCKARKMTKNHYHRDDPAFVVVQLVFLAVSCLSYVTAFQLHLSPSFLQAWLTSFVWQVLVGYVVSGIVCVALTYGVAAKFMAPKGHVYEVRRDVEFLYALDIHCNAYFSYFMWTHVVQYFLLPLLLGSSFSARFLSNAIYAAGATHYFHTTFKGYVELPFLSNQQVLLYPLVVLYGLFVLTMIVPFNCTNYMTASLYA
eukprot:PhM_4_TR10713/c0_g2_i1/m.63759